MSNHILFIYLQAPIFNKKEEIFMMLCDYQVPMLRAAWFIKLSSAYTVAVSEAKIKKRQLPDPSQGKFFMDEFRNCTSISFSCFLLLFFSLIFTFF